MTTHIRAGWRHGWIDYDRDRLTRWQITLPEHEAQRLSNEVAIALSLVIPCFYIVVRRLVLAALPVMYSAISYVYNLITRMLGCSGQRSASPQHNGSAITLGPLDEHGHGSGFIETLDSTGDEDNPFRAMRKLLIGLRKIRETEDSISGELRKVLMEDFPSAAQRLWAEPQLAGATLSVSILVLGLCLLGIWAGIESANTLTDNVALSDYVPGIQWYAGYAGSLQESAAGKYRDECYNISIGDSFLSGGGVVCNQFYQATIPYTAVANTSCPFDGNVCVPGSTSAVTFSTGWMDVNTLGINAPQSDRLKMEKSMTCSPVSNEEPWVILNAWGNWEYYYQDCDDGSGSPRLATYGNAGDWSRYNSPLHGYSAEAIRLSSSWQPGFLDVPCVVPRPEFKSGSRAISLIFVVPLGRMTFANYRDDPVFPAKEDAFPIPGLGYRSTTTRAGILGCVDAFRVCNSAGSRCWDQGNWAQTMKSISTCSQGLQQNGTPCAGWSQQDPSPEEWDALFLLDVALRDTDAGGAIRNRGGFGLDAAKMLGRDDFIFSLLAVEQWKVEAENFFQTSLARMQINVFDFIRGTYVTGLPDNDTLIRVPEYAANTYQMYKFRTDGYRNVSGFWFVAINVFCVVLFIWSRRYSTPEQREDHIKKGGNGGYHDNLWGTIALKKCGELVLGTWRALVATCRSIRAKVFTLVRKFKDLASRGQTHGRTNGHTAVTA